MRIKWTLYVVLPALMLASGCVITSEESPGATTKPPVQTVTPDEEPTPVVNYDGKTKTVTLGDVKVAATVEVSVINLVVTASNATEKELSYSIDVAISNGETPVFAQTFDIRNIEPGLTKKESSEIDISGYTRTVGEPKVFINDVTTYTE
ncbi:hypothetical protein [Streptomyces halobius]|uniref:Lipoprotein n=1 Tax=Streptomyces halobius TaxID=2879846 RepID=A0ABY4MH49_9ACTN|nr:hypothetical protein [Streptomyces halobius]UQA95681.1 hypothetical protein K9S39_30870 [Streptomyces halobius]